MPSAANFRASECRAELVRAMPSAAENLEANIRASENIELVKIRATYKVAFIKRFIIRVYFLTFSAALGIARTSSALHSLARKLAALGIA